MTTTQVINQTLWNELRQTINRAYEQQGKGLYFDDGIGCLRDYAENVSMSDDLAKLLESETSNEKQHRQGRSVLGFSSGTSAKLILMHNIADGAEMKEMPKATAFLVLRKTAVEAQVIGFLIRKHLAKDWKKAVRSYDYSKLMQEAGRQ